MGITNVVLFECIALGVPILVAFRNIQSTIFVITLCVIESVSCLSILLPMFLPKLTDSRRKTPVRVTRTPTIAWSSVSEFVVGKRKGEPETCAGPRVTGLNTRPKPKPRPQPVSEGGGSGAFGVVRVVSRYENNLEPNHENLDPIAEGSGVVGDELEAIVEDSGSTGDIM
jgi:hypothetical protein